jgi:murein DD-endopeptidase MepM/ murein hydrolase activator NlpD
MILSPLRDTKDIKWRTRISQQCTLLPDGKVNPDENPATVRWALEYYKQFGYTKGHIGIDIACPVGTPVYATEYYDHIIVKEHRIGYGLHVEAYGCFREKEKVRNVVRLAHLQRVVVKTGDRVRMGDLIGYSGQSGGTSPHLHIDLQDSTQEMQLIDPRDGSLGRKFLSKDWIIWWE